jgi:hypothetical protein
MKRKYTDLAIAIFIVVILVFGHIATIRSRAEGSPAGRLLLQGAGGGYGGPAPDETLGTMEFQATDMLRQLGMSEASYASKRGNGRYGNISDLVMSGELAPNATGAGLAPGYSITFLTPATKNGFTLIAEPTNYQLRPLMIDEGQKVYTMVPTLDGDPDTTWGTARSRMENSIDKYGYYMYPVSADLLTHNPPIQARIDWEGRNYVILSLSGSAAFGYVPDPSVVYSSYLRTYLIGDTRR